MANYTHTEYSHLAQKCWQLLQGAEKIIIILQAARNQIICTHKRFSFWSLLCLACLGGGEKETYCLLKSKTVGLVLVLQEWRGLCAITVKTSSLQISLPAPLGLQLVCQIPTGQEALHSSCWRRNIPPQLSVIGE